MNNRRRMASYQACALLLALSACAISCSNLFGNYANPVDPNSSSYQGHESVAATSLYLNSSSLSLFVGGTSQLTASLIPTNATDKVVWSSSDSGVASVSSSGKVTGLAEGTATITAKISSKLYSTCSVRVYDYTTLNAGTLYYNTIYSSSQWFKVAVVKGQTYSVYWEDKVGSNYTAYVSICVYADANATTALWDGYYHATKGKPTKTFIAQSTTAYICVEPYLSGYGSYRLRVY